MTTTAVAWDEHREQELQSTLACLTQLANYRVGFEWEAECDGANNDLYTGVSEIPGVDEGTDEWFRLSRIRAWWQFIRLEHGLTVAEAAAQIGFSVSTLARWESGERTPTLPADPGMSSGWKRRRPSSKTPTATGRSTWPASETAGPRRHQGQSATSWSKSSTELVGGGTSGDVQGNSPIRGGD